MPTLAAIDVGSNAIRLLLAETDGKRDFRTIENCREPVRLGQDVFHKGQIAESTMGKAVAAFRKFRGMMDGAGVRVFRAVGTSALREAKNRDLLFDRITGETGIEVQVIGVEEEARLVHQAIVHKLDLKNSLVFEIDIGGGSVEVSLAQGREMLHTQSYKMGAVRLLQVLGENRREGHRFHQLVREYVDGMRRRIEKDLAGRSVEICVGVGGNIESLGDLRQELLGKESNAAISVDEIDEILRKLQGMSLEERIRKLGLRPDRADVIVPASIVLQRLLKIAKISKCLIPRVGLKEGLALDLVDEIQGNALSRPEAVLTAARRLGARFSWDEAHGEQVAKLALRLFDSLQPLHRLPEDSRRLLQIAALTHDLGHNVNPVGHHKHSQYLLQANPLPGLSSSQMDIVANVARYHRKASPKTDHESYKLLSPKDRVVVSKLAAILRLADALDTEHAGRVQDVETEIRDSKVRLRLRGQGDLLLEKWALLHKGSLFEEVFSRRLDVGDLE